MRAEEEKDTNDEEEEEWRSKMRTNTVTCWLRSNSQSTRPLNEKYEHAVTKERRKEKVEEDKDTNKGGQKDM